MSTRCLMGAVLAALAPVASAQEKFPSRPITMVVAFPPGGVADTTARPTAAAMEKVTQKPFHQYAKETFRGWGLRDLGPEMDPVPAHRSMTYTVLSGKLAPVAADNLSEKWAGGGFESGVDDLCRLGRQLAQGKILETALRDEMWTERKAGATATGYGLGWRVGMDGGKRFAAHSGSQPGANSYWRVMPDDDVVVIVLSNTRGHNPQALGTYLARAGVTPKGDVLPALRLPAAPAGE